MNELIIVLVTLILATVADWSWRLWERRSIAKSRQDAVLVLKKHGLEAYTYLPSFGAQDGELREALTALDYSGQVVIDNSSGRLIGRALPKVQQKGSGLRMVVDNTK